VKRYIEVVMEIILLFIISMLLHELGHFLAGVMAGHECYFCIVWTNIGPAFAVHYNEIDIWIHRVFMSVAGSGFSAFMMSLLSFFKKESWFIVLLQISFLPFDLLILFSLFGVLYYILCLVIMMVVDLIGAIYLCPYIFSNVG